MSAANTKKSLPDEVVEKAPRQASGGQHLDHQLAQILSSIAHLLLRQGYGFSRLSKLAKIAFVDAAKVLDVSSRPKISIARIAAITGLTRTEVSLLLRSQSQRKIANNEPLNRAARVEAGWLSDKEYCDARGKPKPLQFNSRRPSFSRLVKKYSGDIPARAMLVEMKRLRMVRHDVNDVVRLEKVRRRGSRLTISAMRAITPWVLFFADIEKLGQTGELTSNASHLTLQFESIPQILAANRVIETRRSTFVEGLKQLGVRPNQKTNYKLDVSVAVAIAAATPKLANRRRKRED